MGIRLSSIGGLTNSQKAGLDRAAQDKLLAKLSGMSINKPILTKVEEEKKAKKKAIEKRGYAKAQEKVKEAKAKTYKSEEKSSD